MEKIKNNTKISEILESGNLKYKDPDTGYTWTLCAVCPVDGCDCGITSHDRDTEGTSSRITRVVFACPSCGRNFSAKAEEMYFK